MSDPSIVLSATPGTDIWRKPPALNVFNAPCLAEKTVHSSVFSSARVTVSAAWTVLYDQGGLFVRFPLKDGQTSDQRFWMKTGIEWYNDRANLSTVTAREWADWSLIPLDHWSNTVTVEIEREAIDAEKGAGSSLWVYLVKKTGDKEERVAVRECTWAFETEGDIEIGVYAARPTDPADHTPKNLEVELKGFSVECKDIREC